MSPPGSIKNTISPSHIFAVWAYFSNQPLGNEQLDGRGHQVGLHADVNQSAEGGGGIIGVQCAEHQMTSQ